jgi:hypothetical protein
MRNLQELIDELTNLIETGECDGSEPVLFAHQPNYPLQCAIDGPNVLPDEDSPTQEDVDHFESRIEIAEDWDSEEERQEAMVELERMRVRRGSRVVYLFEGGWRPRRLDGSEFSPYASRSIWSGD